MSLPKKTNNDFQRKDQHGLEFRSYPQTHGEKKNIFQKNGLHSNENDHRLSIDSNFSISKSVYNRDMLKDNMKTSDNYKSKNTAYQCTLHLPVRPQSNQACLRFTITNQTLFLRLKNESQLDLDISLISLPTNLGFSTREVRWNVPAIGDSLLQVTWRGKTNCRGFMVLKVGSSQLRILLESDLEDENSAVLRSPLAPIRASVTQVQSPSNMFKTPLPQNKMNRRESIVPPSSTYSTMTGVPGINGLSTSKKLKKFHMDTRLIKAEQPTSRLEALQMELQKKKIQQKQWISALPIHIDDLKEEIKRLKKEYSQSNEYIASSTIGSNAIRSTTHNAKLRLLKNWVQIVLAYYGIDPSRFDPNDDQIIYAILVNAYRTNPKDLKEVLTPMDYERLTFVDLNDSMLEDSDDESNQYPFEEDTWMNRFQILIGLEEYESPPEEDKIRMIKLSKLCHKLVEKRRSVHLMNALLFVQNNVRRTIVLQDQIRRKRAAVAIQRSFRLSTMMKKYKCAHDLVCLTQSSLRCILAQQESEMNRKRRYIIRLQGLARMLQTQEYFKQKLYSVKTSQSFISRFVSQLQTERMLKFVTLSQSIIRRNLVTPIETERQQITHIQSIIRSNTSQWSTNYQFSATQWIQRNVMRTYNQNNYFCMKDRINFIQNLLRKEMTPRIEYHVEAVIWTQSHLKALFTLENFKYQKFLVELVQSNQRMQESQHNISKDLQSLNWVQNNMRQFYSTIQFNISYLSIISVQSTLRRNIEFLLRESNVDHVKKTQSIIRTWLNAFSHSHKISQIALTQSLIRTQNTIKIQDASIKKIITTQNSLRTFTDYWYTKSLLDCVKLSQMNLRRELSMQHFGDYHNSIVFVQSHIRKDSIPSIYSNRQSVVKTQSIIRTLLQTKLFNSTLYHINFIQSIQRRDMELQSSLYQLRIIQFVQNSIRANYASITLNYDSKYITLLQNNIRYQLQSFKMYQQLFAIQWTQSLLRSTESEQLKSKQILSITCLQSKIRTLLATHRFNIQSRNTSFIQSCIRRNYAVDNMVQNRNNTILIQSMMRTYFVKWQTLEAERRVRNYQRAVRMILVSPSHLQSKSVVSLQNAIRSNFETNICSKALSIVFDTQKILRTSYQKIEACKEISIIEAVQRMIRKQIVTPASLEISSIIKVQSVLRSRFTLNTFNKKRRSATKIQATWRSFISYCMRNYSLYLVKFSQSIFRKNLQPSIDTYVEKIVKVQSIQRQIQVFSQFKHNVHSILPVQSLIRSQLSMFDTKKKISSVCLLQNIIRSIESQSSTLDMKLMIASIQNGLRSSQSQHYSKSLLVQVLNVQNVARANEVNTQKCNMLQQIINLQSNMRSIKSIAQLEENRYIVTFVQNKIRTFEPIYQSTIFLSNIINVQSKMRTFLEINKINAMRKQILHVQYCFNESRQAALDKEYLNFQIHQVINTQSSLRSFQNYSNFENTINTIKSYQRFIHMKTTMNQFIRDKKSISLLQNISRANIAVDKLKFDLSTFGIQTRAAIKIQKVFRGYESRCIKYKAQQKMLQAKLVQIKLEFEERKKIQKKTRKGMNILLTSKQMTSVMKACADLDNATTVSEKSCRSMCHEGVLLQLMHLIKTCNRSEPHVKLLVHMLNILINVSKDVYRGEYVFNTNECIDILVEQLQMYRDKPEIFLRAMKILEQLTVPNNTENECSLQFQRMQKLRDMHGTVKRIHGVAALLEGKYKLEKKFEETQRAQLSRLSIGGAHSRRMSISGTKSIKQTPVILCYESLISFMKHLEGKVTLSEEKPEDLMTMEDRKLNSIVQRASITPSQALLMLNSQDTFTLPMDRRVSIAPSSKIQGVKKPKLLE